MSETQTAWDHADGSYSDGAFDDIFATRSHTGSEDSQLYLSHIKSAAITISIWAVAAFIITIICAFLGNVASRTPTPIGSITTYDVLDTHAPIDNLDTTYFADAPPLWVRLLNTVGLGGLVQISEGCEKLYQGCTAIEIPKIIGSGALLVYSKPLASMLMTWILAARAVL